MNQGDCSNIQVGSLHIATLNVRGLGGDHHTNSRGYSLPPYLDELNLHRIKTPLGQPTYQLNHNAWSIIDYIYSLTKSTARVR